jgi:hypothetical protein
MQVSKFGVCGVSPEGRGLRGFPGGFDLASFIDLFPLTGNLAIAQLLDLA